MKRFIYIVFAVSCAISFAKEAVEDNEGNFVLLQHGGKHYTLLYLSCTGGKSEYIDSLRPIYDSLGWNIAVSRRSQNHRDPSLNENDILFLANKLLTYPQVDSYGIVIYGFSGQGAQALATALKFPALFAGIITECAHHGLLSDIDWENATGLSVLLVTRDMDWNRQSNEQMEKIFLERNLNVRLLITPGEHRIGSFAELLGECRIMMEMLK